MSPSMSAVSEIYYFPSASAVSKIKSAIADENFIPILVLCFIMSPRQLREMAVGKKFKS